MFTINQNNKLSSINIETFVDFDYVTTTVTQDGTVIGTFSEKDVQNQEVAIESTQKRCIQYLHKELQSTVNKIANSIVSSTKSIDKVEGKEEVIVVTKKLKNGKIWLSWNESLYKFLNKKYRGRYDKVVEIALKQTGLPKNAKNEEWIRSSAQNYTVRDK